MGSLEDEYSKRIQETVMREAVTGSSSSSQSGRLQFSQSETPQLNKLTCLYFSIQQEPRSLHSHMIHKRLRTFETLTLAKYHELTESWLIQLPNTWEEMKSDRRPSVHKDKEHWFPTWGSGHPQGVTRWIWAVAYYYYYSFYIFFSLFFSSVAE